MQSMTIELDSVINELEQQVCNTITATIRVWTLMLGYF